MSRAAAVLTALFFAVHVSVLGVPAPVPVLLVFALVIGALLWMIWEKTDWAAAIRRAGP
ncbi:MAG: hypothetical protein ACRDOI_09955 [Trebonia sp.]